MRIVPGIPVLLLVLSACLRPVPPGPGPEPPPDPDGPPASCQVACERLIELGCPAGQGSPGPDDVMGTEDDVACDVACEQTQELIPLPTTCIARAESCAAVDACEVP